MLDTESLQWIMEDYGEVDCMIADIINDDYGGGNCENCRLVMIEDDERPCIAQNRRCLWIK